jgi:hypothetical protein
VGSQSRYDKPRPVTDQAADEARALHTLAELLDARPAPLTELSDRVRGQIGQVFHMTANELGRRPGGPDPGAPRGARPGQRGPGRPRSPTRPPVT